MFDREKVRLIRKRLEEQIAPLAKELGVMLDVGNASFTNNNINFKLVVAAIGKDGQVLTPEAEAWKLEARFFGLDPDALGKTFTYGGKQYKITGLATRKSRFPVQADRVPDGQGFNFPLEVVKSQYPAK